MLSVPTDQFPGAKNDVYRETVNTKWARKSFTLGLTSLTFYPLIRGWVAYVSQWEYIRQESGALRVPWAQSRYRGWSEAMQKLYLADGWYRGLGPFLALGPIVSFGGVVRTRLKKAFPEDGTLATKAKRFLVTASVASACEIVCFPLRVAYILMASEPHTLSPPRPTARQILADILKYGPTNKALQLSFVPGLLGSILATAPADEQNALSLTILSYFCNLMSIRMIIASTPGAPSSYISYHHAMSTHVKNYPRTWMVGLISFFIPVITMAYTRTELDNIIFELIAFAKGIVR